MPGFTILISIVLDVLDNVERQGTEIRQRTGKEIKSATMCTYMIAYPET